MSGQHPGPTKTISTTPSHRSTTRCLKMELQRLHPSLWLMFTAFLLLFFSCISGSAWSEISFLNAQFDGHNVAFGVFGYTGISQPTLGYNISQAVGPINPTMDDYLSDPMLRGLEMALIIHLLATILLFIACGIMFWCRDVGKKAGFLRFVKYFFWGLASVGTFFLFLFDVGVFTKLRDELRDNGIPADLGNANWITLGASIALLIEPCWALLELTCPKALQRRPKVTASPAPAPKPEES